MHIHLLQTVNILITVQKWVVGRFATFSTTQYDMRLQPAFYSLNRSLNWLDAPIIIYSERALPILAEGWYIQQQQSTQTFSISSHLVIVIIQVETAIQPNGKFIGKHNNSTICHTCDNQMETMYTCI